MSHYSHYQTLLKPTNILGVVEARFIPSTLPTTGNITAATLSQPSPVNVITNTSSTIELPVSTSGSFSSTLLVVPTPTTPQLQHSNIIFYTPTSLLVYEITHDSLDLPSQSTASSVVSTTIAPTSSSNQLKLLHQFDLSARIVHVAVVKSYPSDFLLLAFKDAKMSLVQFSPAINALETVSLHYYEKEEFRRVGIADKYMNPVLTMDPDQRCAILSFYGDKLAVLPIRSNLSGSGEEAANNEGKQPFYPSFVIPFLSIDPSMTHVLDIKFLHGYLEPTFAILYEPEQTHAGMLYVRKDTVCMAVVSLDTLNRSTPVLYYCRGLPYNCTSLLPVPTPLGGVLVVSPNGLIHVDATSLPGTALAVNSYFGLEANKGMSVDNPLYKDRLTSTYVDMGLTLEHAALAFVNPDTLMLVCKDTKSYAIQLLGSEGIGSGWKRRRSGVKGFKITPFGVKLTAPSCMTIIHLPKSRNTDSNVVASSLVFIGSASGNSLVLKLVESQEPVDVTNYLEDGIAINANANGDEMLDDEDEDIYGDSKMVDAGDMVPVWTFQLVDQLDSMYPGRDMAFGPLSENSSPTDLEMVVCAGTGKDGKLVILHEKLRPNVVGRFDINGIKETWAICSSLKSPETSFIVMSRETSSIILETVGDELQEKVGSAFFTAGPTVAVGAFCPPGSHHQQHHKIIVQVHPNGIFLLDHAGNLAGEKLKFGNQQEWAVSAHLCEPYILALLNTGDLILWTLEKASGGIKQRYKYRINKLQEPKLGVSACCLFGDDHFYFTPLPSNSRARTSYIAGVYRENGVLEFYTLPQFDLVFSCTLFDTLPALVVDDGNTSADKSVAALQDLNEILIVSFNRVPHLMVRTEAGDLAIYRAFTYRPTSIGSESLTMQSFHRPLSNLRFQRLPLNHLTRQKVDYEDQEGDKLKPSDSVGGSHGPSFLKKLYLTPFECVRGNVEYEGVFVSGSTSFMIMMGKTGAPLPALVVDADAEARILPSMSRHGHGRLVMHPLEPQSCFSPLNTRHLPSGFLLLTQQGNLKICNLPKVFDFSTDWPTCTVPLGRTPCRITYHSPSHTYIMCVGTYVPFVLAKAQYEGAVAASVTNEDGTSLEAPTVEEGRPPGMFYPSIEAHRLELVSPVTWETVDTFSLTDSENVLSVCTIELDSEETKSGKKTFIAVGTAYYRGLEVTCRGRILLLEIIDVVPEADNPQTNHKFKLVSKTDEKGPVTALAECNGQLVAAIGQKILIHTLEEGSLTGIAFMEISLFATQIRCIHNLILVSDIQKSIWFIGFQQEPSKLSLLGKDTSVAGLAVTCADFMIDGPECSFVVGDVEGNIHVMNYSPYELNSLAGQRLIRTGDLYAGLGPLSACHRLRACPRRDPATQEWIVDQLFGVLSLSSDGAIALISPVSEKMYRRLFALYSKMVVSIEHVAGINPRGFRQVVAKCRPITCAFPGPLGPPGPRNILDGDLLSKFSSLPVHFQRDLERMIGSNRDRLMDDLVEVGVTFGYF